MSSRHNAIFISNYAHLSNHSIIIDGWQPVWISDMLAFHLLFPGPKEASVSVFTEGLWPSLSEKSYPKGSY